MVYQAEHDAEAFKTALAKVKSEADSELRRRTAELAASHAAAAEAAAAQIESLANEMERSEMRVAALATELERFGVEREAAEREAEAEHRAELASRLEEQAEAHALAIAECLVRERVARAEALDEIRLKLNGVKEAYDVNGKSLQKSHASVKMSLAVFALQSKVANGDPFHEELSAVATVASDAMAVDDTAGRALVHAVVGSIPEAVAKSGVPTAGRLTERLADVRRAARRLSLVPETGGGIVAHLVAYLASWLRMSEPTSGWGGGGGGTAGGGVEAAVATARANVAAGRLDVAAAALEEGTEGTAAARAVAGWVADARERQRLEMAVSVLRSHAAAAAASLA
jgi:mitofilin